MKGHNGLQNESTPWTRGEIGQWMVEQSERPFFLPEPNQASRVPTFVPSLESCSWPVKLHFRRQLWSLFPWSWYFGWEHLRVNIYYKLESISRSGSNWTNANPRAKTRGEVVPTILMKSFSKLEESWLACKWSMSQTSRTWKFREIWSSLTVTHLFLSFSHYSPFCVSLTHYLS